MSYYDEGQAGDHSSGNLKNYSPANPIYGISLPI